MEIVRVDIYAFFFTQEGLMTGTGELQGTKMSRINPD